MAVGKSLHLRALAGLLGALAACGGEEIRESVFTVESFCSLTPRLAIVVEILATEGTSVDAVTANLESEQRCYLERVRRVNAAADAGAPESVLYSCLSQGAGKYEVHVTSGKKTWTQSAEVTLDMCQVEQLQRLTFEIE